MPARHGSSAVARLRLTLLLVALAVLAATTASSAQPIPPIIQPTPTPTARLATPTPRPATPKPVPPSPTPAPPIDAPRPSAPSVDPGQERPSPSPGPGVTPAPNTGTITEPLAVAQSGLIPPGVKIPVFARTPGRNTIKLVQILERLESIGIPRDRALVEGMGRFPVGGVAFYSDDWMAPRFTPFFHLHEGLDIFADFGTPVRSPDRGTVTRTTDGPIGGLAVWVTGQDGAEYYFAHLQGYAAGVAPGMRVETGTVVGFVGDSGNAQGGAPHLHFEVHRGRPVPPKPYVDQWLADAERGALVWVQTRIGDSIAERQLLRSEHALAPLLAVDTSGPLPSPEYPLLLTVLDPVGGSAGLLPRLAIVPGRPPGASTSLMDELIRRRIDGSVLSTIAGMASGPDAG